MSVFYLLKEISWGEHWFKLALYLEVWTRLIVCVCVCVCVHVSRIYMCVYIYVCCMCVHVIAIMCNNPMIIALLKSSPRLVTVKQWQRLSIALSRPTLMSRGVYLFLNQTLTFASAHIEIVQWLWAPGVAMSMSGMALEIWWKFLKHLVRTYTGIIINVLTLDREEICSRSWSDCAWKLESFKPYLLCSGVSRIIEIPGQTYTKLV